MSSPPVDPFANQEPAAILAYVATMLGADVPDDCAPGVVANARLLSQHWASLRQAGERAAPGAAEA